MPYKSIPIGPRTGETKTPEFTVLNPRQKIPLLQDGDFCIGESAAIVAYLSRTYPTSARALLPGGVAPHSGDLFVQADLGRQRMAGGDDPMARNHHGAGFGSILRL